MLLCSLCKLEEANTVPSKEGMATPEKLLNMSRIKAA